MNSEIQETNKKIADLQQKLGIQVSEEQKKPTSAKLKSCSTHDKTRPKTAIKKTKKVTKKKLSKKSKEEKKEDEKDIFTKVNEKINKMVKNINKVVSEQLNKKTKEVEVEKKKIEESKIQLKEEEMKGLFNFESVSKNISEELNKWTKFIQQHTTELTNTLSEKYNNCVDMITSLNKKEEEAIPKKIKFCSLCGSQKDFHTCVCHELICVNCLEKNKLSSHKECYSFTTGLNVATNMYNVSKKALPRNFECKITFLSVAWIRVGITFDPKIAEYSEDNNIPPFDIYCILEDLKLFCREGKFKWLSNKRDLPLRKGDNMIMRFKNGELRYYINGEELSDIIKIPLDNKGEFYLFIQCREDIHKEKSKAKIDYITEIIE